MHIPDGSNFTPAPSGAHRAICIGFIDLGTQKTEYQGQVSHKRLVRLRWELPDELMQDGKPFTISKRYTWSMSDKASLRKDLESWRGKPFEKSDFGRSGFDTQRLLGVPCLLTIVHKEGANGTFANISAISPLPKGMEKPGQPVNRMDYIALEKDRFNPDIFDLQHEKTKEQIRLSPEYQEVVNGIVQAPANGHEELEDEIPF